MAIHHVSIAVSLYASHSVILVVKADARGGGRPPRVLATVRHPVGFLDLVGLPSLDAALTVARWSVEALARGDDIRRPKAPAPPEGATGAAVDPLKTDKLPTL